MLLKQLSLLERTVVINFLTLEEGYAKHPSIYYDKIEFITSRMLGEACPKNKEFYELPRH